MKDLIQVFSPMRIIQREKRIHFIGEQPKRYGTEKLQDRVIESSLSARS